ncbi:hypothetical protein Ancab_034303 [Ancistrocladus abbreviatus]
MPLSRGLDYRKFSKGFFLLELCVVWVGEGSLIVLICCLCCVAGPSEDGGGVFLWVPSVGQIVVVVWRGFGTQCVPRILLKPFRWWPLLVEVTVMGFAEALVLDGGPAAFGGMLFWSSFV